MSRMTQLNQEIEELTLEIAMHHPTLYYLLDETPLNVTKGSISEEDLEDYISTLNEQLKQFNKQKTMTIAAKFLLEASLDQLHFQTKEWIDEVKFYSEELNFLNGLIVEKIDTRTTKDIDHKEIYRNIDTLLFKLSDDLLKNLYAHEKLLAKIISAKNPHDNKTYRIDHIALSKKMKALEMGIKHLKKALFTYLKNNPFEFSIDTLIQEIDS